MQIISPYLWFDNQAKEAAQFYVDTFKNSKIKSVTTLDNTPSGSVEMVSMELAGQEFGAISAGPLFKFNPSVSFLVACETKEEVDAVWARLSQGGSTLMPLEEYTFSGRYGWTTDKFGLSWQVMLMDQHVSRQKITPTMMFSGDMAGKAEEAVEFYTSIFSNAKIGDKLRYEKGESPDKEGTIKYVSFTLEGQEFAAMDSARAKDVRFNEAISFVVRCEAQENIDYYWSKLSAHPNAEQCGWLKDKFGFSWQIVPAAMDKMLASSDKATIDRVTQAFLKMKKFDIATLQRAFDGR